MASGHPYGWLCQRLDSRQLLKKLADVYNRSEEKKRELVGAGWFMAKHLTDWEIFVEIDIVFEMILDTKFYGTLDTLRLS